jgi:hypothetical protein
MTLSIALLRRLALGLPLIVLPAAAGVLLTNTACSCGGSCPTRVWSGTLSATQMARFPSSGAQPTELCTFTCNELLAAQTDAGPLDAASSVADAMLPDAGPPGIGFSGGYSCSLEGNALSCTFQTYCVGGRAPQGLLGAQVARRGVGSLFAEMAHLESAAIPAFEDLAEELALHDAPRSLRRGARRGVEDERRHARSVSALAHRYGGITPEVARSERAPRSLFEMAADNAFEGCVREAYGAVEAAHQAAHAADPAVRAAFNEIAREEAQHALLSLAIDGWARTRLSPRARHALTELRAEGVSRLRAGLEAERGRDLRVLAGMPSATRANDLLSLVA